MELAFRIDEISAYQDISMICAVLLILCVFVFIFWVDEIYERRNRIIATVVLSIVAVLSLSTLVYSLYQKSYMENEDISQISQVLEYDGMELLDPSEIDLYSHNLKEMFLLKSDGDIVKLAYRIGRCDCYFFVYNIRDDGSYREVTKTQYGID